MAQEALEIGLINKIYPVADFNTQAMEYVQNIASLPTRTLGYNKAMLNFSLLNDLVPSIQHEFNLYVKNMGLRIIARALPYLEKNESPILKENNGL